MSERDNRTGKSREQPMGGSAPVKIPETDGKAVVIVVKIGSPQNVEFSSKLIRWKPNFHKETPAERRK